MIIGRGHRRRRRRRGSGRRCERTPGCVDRLFTDGERDAAAQLPGRPVRRQGGAGQGARRPGGHALARLPRCAAATTAGPTSTSAARCGRGSTCSGITSLHVSLSHDAGIASAVVIAERTERERADDRGLVNDPTCMPPRTPSWPPSPRASSWPGPSRAWPPSPRPALGSGTAPGSSPSSGRATTAVTPCMPRPGWPRPGSAPPRCAARRCHAGRARRRGGGRRPARRRRRPRRPGPDRRGRRRPRRHPRHRRPRRSAGVGPGLGGRSPRRRACHRRRPAVGPGPGRARPRPRRGVRRRDGDLLGRQAGPPPAAHRAGRRPAHRRRHRPRPSPGPAGRRRLTHDDAADAVAGAGAGATTSTPAGSSGSSPVARATPARPSCACTAAVEAGVGMVRYVGTPQPEALVRAAVPEAVHGAGRVQAWAIGSGLDVGRRGRRRAAARRGPRRAGSDVPVLLDAGGLDLLDGPATAPTLLTPHAGEAGPAPRPAQRRGGRPAPRSRRLPSSTPAGWPSSPAPRSCSRERRRSSCRRTRADRCGARRRARLARDGGRRRRPGRGSPGCCSRRASSRGSPGPWPRSSTAWRPSGPTRVGRSGRSRSLAAFRPRSPTSSPAADRSPVASPMPGRVPPRLEGAMTTEPAAEWKDRVPTPAAPTRTVPAGSSAWVSVDLDAISDNVARAAPPAPEPPRSWPWSRPTPMVTASSPSARAALRGGATWLGVAQLAEALQLRAAGVTAPPPHLALRSRQPTSAPRSTPASTSPPVGAWSLERWSPRPANGARRPGSSSRSTPASARAGRSARPGTSSSPRPPGRRPREPSR